jgi:carbonic anhydrase
MLSPAEALQRLQDGNQQFVSGIRDGAASVSAERRLELAHQQAPFAIILGCSDSRVPAELVFGQGIGDLFVIRVAGNVVAPSGIGSVEFAAEMFGTRLVVVLGHSRCGAVAATIDELRHQAQYDSRNLRSIVDRVAPAVTSLVETGGDTDRDELIEQGVRANVLASVEALRNGSDVLVQLVAEQGLAIVGARYSLETGCVEFLEETTAGVAGP